MTKRDSFLTAEGAARLREELALLKGPRRTELAGRLRHAVQMGDLSENADYTVAKEEQAFLEGRILELETLLREAVIVEGAGADVAAVGSTVVVSESGGPAETFMLVGVKEADPRQGRISHEFAHRPGASRTPGRRYGAGDDARRHADLQDPGSALNSSDMEKQERACGPLFESVRFAARVQERASVPRGHARSSIVRRSK